MLCVILCFIMQQFCRFFFFFFFSHVKPHVRTSVVINYPVPRRFVAAVLHCRDDEIVQHEALTVQPLSRHNKKHLEFYSLCKSFNQTLLFDNKVHGQTPHCSSCPYAVTRGLMYKNKLNVHPKIWPKIPGCLKRCEHTNPWTFPLCIPTIVELITHGGAAPVSSSERLHTLWIGISFIFIILCEKEELYWLWALNT